MSLSEARAATHTPRGGASRGVRSTATTRGSDALARLLLADMSGSSEDMPQGVPPSYDWAGHPRAHDISSFRTYDAFSAWGQLYQCAGTPTSPRESVQLRNMQAWILLRGSRRWQRRQLSSSFAGANFPEDYSGASSPGHFVISRTGTAIQMVPRRNAHFWPATGRVPLAGARVAAIVVGVEARLRPSTSGHPCVVLSVGGDMWRSITAVPGTGANGDIGIGRFKRVQRRWRLFTMTAGSLEAPRRPLLPAFAPTDELF